MKNIGFVFLTLVIFMGCVPATTGKFNKNMKSTDPYEFVYYGPVDSMIISVKRTLALEGFSGFSSDTSAGIFQANGKTLQDDEAYKNSFAMALAGVSVKEQRGNITFIYSKISNGIRISMICRLQADAQYHRNAFSSTDLKTNDMLVPQGHPFAVKYRNLLMNMNKFRLLTPIIGEDQDRNSWKSEQDSTHVDYMEQMEQ